MDPTTGYIFRRFSSESVTMEAQNNKQGRGRAISHGYIYKFI
jgi:hypothetical protein